jgi:hypothetical protein
MTTTILLCGNALCRELPGGRARVHAIETHLEDTVHQGPFFLINFVTPLFVPSNVTIPQGDGPTLRISGLGASKLAAFESFEDFCAFILCDGTTHLEEEPPFWTFFEGMRDNKQTDTRLLQFLTEQ